MKKLTGIFIGVLCFINNSYAALTVIDSNLVNDSKQNITWLRDGNHIKTLCDANDTVWQSWPEPNPTVAGNSGRTKNQICALETGGLTGMKLKTG